jgi:hypothetical protein
MQTPRPGQANTILELGGCNMPGKIIGVWGLALAKIQAVSALREPCRAAFAEARGCGSDPPSGAAAAALPLREVRAAPL